MPAAIYRRAKINGLMFDYINYTGNKKSAVLKKKNSTF